MPAPRHVWLWIAIPAVLLGAAMVALLLLWPAPPSPPPLAPAAPVVAGQPAPPPAALDLPAQIQPASIAEIEAGHAASPSLFRLEADPAVLVLDLPDLHVQALMLNRIAALVEKSGLPRDRVLAEAELDARIRAAGRDPDRYYYGHDYRAADLARFFRLAEAQAMPLNPAETWLRDLLDREGWRQEGAVGALISIPGRSAASLAAGVDASARATILRHELSHAVSFTDPAYVALTRHLWEELFSDEERAAMRAFLGRDGYDTGNDDLIANEAQAYFIHTRDPRYFTPDLIGIGPAREAALRSAFIEAIPEPWLRDSALAVAPLALSAATWSARAHPRRPVRRAGAARRSPRPAHPRTAHPLPPADAPR